MVRFLLVGLLAVVPAAAWAADLSVTDAFSRATPGRGPGVAYFTIHGGDVADRLVGVASPRAPKVELHTMTMDGDVMRMREIDGVDVPANGTVALAPGGLHLMLMDLPAPLRVGDTVPLTLHFAHAGDRTIQVPVGPIAASGPMMPMLGAKLGAKPGAKPGAGPAEVPRK